MGIVRDLFSIFDAKDKKNFYQLSLVLLLNGFISVLGIGAVLPFITSLLYPEKLQEFSFFQGLSYHNIVLFSVAGLIFAFWLKNIVSFLALKYQTRVLYGIGAKISKVLFRNVMQADYIWHINKNTPELIRNINNETWNFSVNVVNSFGSILCEAISAVVILIALLFIDFKFTFIVAIFLGLFVGTFLYLTKAKSDKYGKLRTDAWAEQANNVINGLHGIKEIKLYNREKYFTSNFNTAADHTATCSSFSTINQQSSRLFIEAGSITVVMLAVYFFISIGVSSEKMLLLLSVFGIASVQLMPGLNRMMQSISLVRYFTPSIAIMNQGMYRDPKYYTRSNTDNTSNLIDFNKSISVQSVSFRYDKQTVLKDISFRIFKGQTVAFVGSSGAGKSTIVDILMGLLNPNSGCIAVDGLQLNSENLSSWQSCFGYVPQQIVLFSGTIKQNIVMGMDAKGAVDDDIWQALKIANLDTFVLGLPDGLDTNVGESGVKLSGGQRQRIGIARALYNKPKILVLDEATAALDNKTEKEVTQAINQASVDRTVIVIAHRLSTIRHSDVIFVLDSGRLVSQGTYDDLEKECSMFGEMTKLIRE